MIHEGQVLNTRYRLIKSVGQGSQASVWVAEHLALGSQVAVKLIDPELAKQDDARARFAREATAAAKLRSAHVVQILDHGIEGDQPFIVMELLDGEDLFQRLDRQHHLSLAETSRIVTHVARALMRAHAEGIIHRDLKPENIFIAPNEDEEIIKVLDFGVAKVTTPHKSVMSKTGAGTLIGTPHYMSPEQVKGIGEIDSRSDLWSLGVIAYQTATGQLPFDSEGVGDLLIRISMDTPTKPTDLNADLPPEFDEWFAKASSKDPDDRYPSARELADSLARIAGLDARPSARRGAAIGNDLDWAAEFTNPGKPLPGREAFHADGKAGAAKPAAGKPADADSDIHVVEGSIPPPPGPHATLPSGGALAAPKPPKPALPGKSAAARPPPPPVPNAALPIWETGDAIAAKSAREVNPTLLSSSSGISIRPPPELDGSGKRRVLWFVAAAFGIGALVVVGTVIQSQMSGSSASTPATANATAAPTTTPVATLQQMATTATASAAKSSAATDPEVTKKTKPVETHAPVSVSPAQVVQDPNGGVEIWVPLPPKDVPSPHR